MSFPKALSLYQQGIYEESAALLREELLLSPTAEKKFWLGKALLATKQWEEAHTAFSACLIHPHIQDKAQINLAIIEAQSDRLFSAEARLRALMPHEEDMVGINLASVLYQQGRAREAKELLCTHPAEQNTTYWYIMGSAQLDLGLIDDALFSFGQATTIDRANADAWIWQAAIYVDQGLFDKAIDCLQNILTIAPKHSYAHFLLAALYDWLDSPHESFGHFSMLHPQQHESWISSWNFVRTHQQEHTDIIGTTVCGFKRIPIHPQGLCIELGVRFGNSIQYLQQHTQVHWHGFDSFAGLPSSWNERAAGSYSTNGLVPDLGSNITLHAGWFHESIPQFMKNHKGPISILHIDCDLYSSTKEALFLLAPWIRSGSILIFDEYLMNPSWKEDEHKAFQEIAQQHQWTYTILSASLFSRQVCVLID